MPALRFTRRHAPACRGITWFGAFPGRSGHKSQHHAALCRQLKAAADGRSHAATISDDSAHARAPQRLTDRPEAFRIILRIEKNRLLSELPQGSIRVQGIEQLKCWPAVAANPHD